MILIISGGILLNLPISSKDGNSVGFLNALFTATSAVCVTGLVVVDTATHWTLFGQIIIIILIQIGGLGFMALTTLFALIVGKKITLRERLVMQEALNQFSIEGVVRLTKNLLIVTLLIEGMGALLLSTRFVYYYGPVKGIYYSVFHSISAFCNAGFDLVGGFRSLTPFFNDVVINIVIMSLIVVGGLGFTVLVNIATKRQFDKFSLHTKLVIYVTGFFIALGFIVFMLLEYSNPGTLRGMPFQEKVLASLFQSVTPRTAGFNTIPIDNLTNASKFFTIILMFIGGSPASTAGGIKTVTFAVVILSVWANIKGREDVEIFQKRVKRQIVSRALVVTVLALLLVIVVTMILSITEKAEFLNILFEVASAFGTVGLSAGITTELSTAGKIIIMITMFSGRVGPLTIVTALAKRQAKNKAPIKYPEDRVIVG
ncbi:MAG: TrkH family potassium uptake protein [Clostridia bacterium]|nr:TrkH family potassium uptake protein [Clostridia bacterium]